MTSKKMYYAKYETAYEHEYRPSTQRVRQAIGDQQRKYGKKFMDAAKNGKQGPRVPFTEHLPKQQYQALMEKGKMFEGILRMAQHNQRKGYVNVNGLTVDVLIDGCDKLNRAMDGDTVVVELLPMNKWPQNEKAAKNNEVNNKYSNAQKIETRTVDQLQQQKEEKENQGIKEENKEELEEDISEEDEVVEETDKIHIYGVDRQSTIENINKIAKEFRPVGKIKAIKASPAREKDHFATLFTDD